MFHGMSGQRHPRLVSNTTDVLNTAIHKIEVAGARRASAQVSRVIDKNYATRWTRMGWIGARCWQRDQRSLCRRPGAGATSAPLEAELDLLREAIGGFKFATTSPMEPEEKKEKGSGGLFSSPSPLHLQRLAACAVEVCADNA